MIITKSEPFTKEEIEQLRECFDTYIKTVIDIQKKVCSAGCDRHYESEKILLDSSSAQNNMSNEIQDATTRKTYEDLTKYFFGGIL